MALFLKYKKRP